MRTIESFQSELFDFFEDLIAREKETIEECRKIGCMNTPGSGMAMGSIDTIKEILDWINEWNLKK